MFAPESVNVPVPLLTRLPSPLITPENSVFSPLPPVVKVEMPSSTLPEPDREPIVSSPSTIKVPLPLTITAPSSNRAEPLERTRVPSLTVVMPS